MWIYTRQVKTSPTRCSYYNKEIQASNETHGGYDRAFEAESMSHDIGRIDGDGWSANTTQDPAGSIGKGAECQRISPLAQEELYLRQK